MSTISWLHLSDLHFRDIDQQRWDEDIVLKALLRDLRICIEDFGLALDLILVSGDVAFSGSIAEYHLAQAFFDELLGVTSLSRERLLIVPGNHDVNRALVGRAAEAIRSSLNSQEAINSVLADTEARRLLLRRFDNYAAFVRGYFGDRIPFDDDHYFYVHSLDLEGCRTRVLGLNSAWLAYGGKEDYGQLALGERQVRQALATDGDATLQIALLHHPFEWLDPFDREQCEALLMAGCDLILSGHLHQPGLLRKETPDTRVITIAAGACYEKRLSRNSYNMVKLDVGTRQGLVYLRAWSNQGSGFWVKDVQTYSTMVDGEFAFSLDAPSIATRLQGSPGAGFWTRDTHTYEGTRDGQFAFDLGDHLRYAPPGGDSLETIRAHFSRHTERSLRLVSRFIPGIAAPLSREEVGRIEEQLHGGKPVALTGDAGTGKSAIGYMLARSAQERGSVVLFLDARQLEHIENEPELQNLLGLNGSFISAVERAGRYNRCRLIIDQLDNVIGSSSATLLRDLAIDLSRIEGVEFVVLSRKREAHEVRLLERLANEGFVELTSHPLDRNQARGILEQLGVSDPTDELTELGRNLLNLELIGRIRQERPGLALSSLTDEADLWEQYRQVLEQEAEQMVVEAVVLARQGLRSRDRTFCLGYPFSWSHRRLISWGVIVCEGGRVYRFRHDKLHEFLYAWDATQRHAMPAEVYQELDAHRARGVLVWMERIYSRQSIQLRNRFLRDVFNVR